NGYRTASGAPGHEYWQQRANYVIDVTLDDSARTIRGKGEITYANHSPDTLDYLWLQLDASVFDKCSDSRLTTPYARATSGSNPFDKFPYLGLEALLFEEKYSSDLKIASVTDASGGALPHTIVKTMMRVDLPASLKPGGTFTFSVAWSYNISDARLLAMRTGYEFFEKDGNYLYEIAQWFPRMAAYSDTTGWQVKHYLGRGEFALEFGDYLVRITAPADHVVTATGMLQNPESVLTPAQRERLAQAATSPRPVFVITPEEAAANEADGATKTTAAAAGPQKTWIFKAENVRDFAFASSRKFIWDAMGAPDHATAVPGRPVMAMSFYPREAGELWQKYSTHAVVHTLDVYSRHTFAYPYPVAISVHGPIHGMEYPMICFNGMRPEEDGTYSRETKYGLISLIIHEVGHNYFPMIVNSDERQWFWMDEGLNSFLQFIAERAWEKNYPTKRGLPKAIVPYMTGPNQVPIMTNVESIDQRGPNSYAKPATALNILRETVLGRELFDHAFKTYANRWKFKRPYPADFFRTIEDASGMDLDWFWRGWFYTNDHVDISIDAVRRYSLDTRDPEIEKARLRDENDKELAKSVIAERNAPQPTRVEAFPELADFYSGRDEFEVLPSERKKHSELVEALKKDKVDPALLKTARNFYLVELSNLGGLVMPVILKINYTDGTAETQRIPAELWRINNEKAAKLIMTPREVASLEVDPREETADANTANNFWPRRPVDERFQLFKPDSKKNPMQELLKKPETPDGPVTSIPKKAAEPAHGDGHGHDHSH
ncbi:MAG: M1 family metallopeptidase, partial [Rariglobus sp.]